MLTEKSAKIIEKLEDVDCELFNVQEAVKEILEDDNALVVSFLQSVDNARLILRNIVGILRKEEV